MWKDVKCTFAILKCRFTILKVRIRCHDVNAADGIWKTCALHNIMLEKDGLSQEWNGELGDLDLDDQSKQYHLQFSI